LIKNIRRKNKKKLLDRLVFRITIPLVNVLPFYYIGFMVPKKGLLFFSRHVLEWAADWPIDHPWNLEILGLSLGNYYLQGFAALGIHEIRVLSDLPSPSTLPKTVQWKQSAMDQGKVSLLRHNRYFFQGVPTLVLSSPFFVFDLWDCQDLSIPSGLQYSSDLPEEEGESFVLLDAGRLATLPWESHPLRSVGDYFFISQILLKGPVPSHLRGQTHVDGGIFHHPKTRFPKNAELGHGVFLGMHTQIGRGSMINRTILYGNQNLGSKVVMENKLVVKNKIYSPHRGTGTEITDHGILKVTE
jgi:hypothetical protein